MEDLRHQRPLIERLCELLVKHKKIYAGPHLVLHHANETLEISDTNLLGHVTNSSMTIQQARHITSLYISIYPDFYLLRLQKVFDHFKEIESHKEFCNGMRFVLMGILLGILDAMYYFEANHFAWSHITYQLSKEITRQKKYLLETLCDDLANFILFSRFIHLTSHETNAREKDTQQEKYFLGELPKMIKAVFSHNNETKGFALYLLKNKLNASEEQITCSQYSMAAFLLREIFYALMKNFSSQGLLNVVDHITPEMLPKDRK